jgi:Ran GTPase-activating protein (RanGAP) involved in mRNA processing and transport
MALRLCRNSIGDARAAILANALTSNTSLTELSLSVNYIGNEGTAVLGEALATNATSLIPDLLGNRTGDEGAPLLLKALTECNSALSDLSLWDTLVSGTVYSAIAALTRANRDGIRLLHAGMGLDLSPKQINCAKAKQIALEIADNAAVTTLLLNRNTIGHQGCTYIAEALVENRVLTSIDLSNKSIGHDGCAAVAKTLRENTVLTKISLNGNGIGLAGAVVLAGAFE